MPKFLIPLLLVTLTACATRGPGGAGGDDVPVQVENRNTYDATIYAYIGQQRQRIGRVGGLQTEMMSSPYPPTGELRFEVRLLAVGAFDSYSVQVARGDTVRVVVPSDLHRRPSRN